MTNELLQSIQFYLIFAVIWGEMVLLAILANRYVLQKFQKTWIDVLLFLIAVPAIFYFSGMAFAKILSFLLEIEEQNNHQAAGFFYVFMVLGLGIKYMFHIVFGAVLSVVIWVVSLVIIRARTPAEGEQL